MAENLIRIDTYRLTPGKFFASLAVTAAINTAIAVILTVIGFGKGFTVTLIFSQCIGTAIFLSNLAAVPLYRTATHTSVQIVIIVASIIVGALAGTLLGALANGMPPVLFFKEHFGFFGQVVLIALLFGFIVSYIFISLEIISQEKIRRLEIEKNVVETELKFLQSQMEPHSLFNTLSNIISLIDTDRDKARRMLESFTAFLRTSLLTARERTVPLSRELEVVKHYLEVYSVRMGDRLRYGIDVPESIRQCRIPPLIIQPLVENAVKHGLEPAIQGGEIVIRASREGGTVRIVVTDSGMGVNEKSAGNGIGLENIKKRLQLAYGERGRLSFEENQPSGVKVSIEIPYYETDAGNHR
jgi:sensor histidine kinase YesM